MEPVQQPTQDNRLLRIFTSAFSGLFAGCVGVSFFLFVAWAIFDWFTTVISLESGGLMALMIDVFCVAPLALITVILIVVLTTMLARKALARVAATRGSHAERRASFFIWKARGP